MGAVTAENELLWPPLQGPSDLAAVERVPLSDRGLPASTYELVRRAAELWPDRPAVSVLPDAESFHTPLVRTYAELASDVHRAAAVLALSAPGLTAAASAQDTFRIGLIVPLTGPFTTVGQEMQGAARLFVRHHGDTVACLPTP